MPVILSNVLQEAVSLAARSSAHVLYERQTATTSNNNLQKFGQLINPNEEQLRTIYFIGGWVLLFIVY
jgi:hypothetical protein